MATLHHQLVYRLQNHAFDLPTPQTTTNALMILVDSSESIPSIVQIPRQIQKQELLKLMPLEWLSNYEKFHQNTQPVQTTDAHFEKRADGTVKLTFQSPSTSQIPIVSHPCHKKSPLPLDDPDCLKPLPIYRKSLRLKQKEYKQRSCRQKTALLSSPAMLVQPCIMFSSSPYQEQFPPLEKQIDPQTKVTTKPFVHSLVTSNGQLEEPKPFEYVLNWQTQNARAHNSVFRSRDEKIEKVAFQVKQTDTKVDKITSQLEQMYLDMQNRVTQLDLDLRPSIADCGVHIPRFVLSISIGLRFHSIPGLDSILGTKLIRVMSVLDGIRINWGPKFNQKEAEIRQLKAELARIDADKQQSFLFAKSPALPLHTPTFSTYQPFYTPSTSRQPVDCAKFFGLSHLKHAPTTAPPKPRSKPPKPEPSPTYHQPYDPQSSPEPQSTQKNKEPMHQYSSQVLPYLSESEETLTDEESFSLESYSSSSNSENSLADISKLLMVQPSTASNDPSPSSPPQTHIVEEADFDTNHTPHQENSSSKLSNGPWFTFDDIPRIKWPARFQEFSA
ncbi:hypothetical protein KPL70_014290 [Citrus sinensis]|nr:hypothetical protein KPL70_014290 [Citrus sinensis]